MFFLLYAYYALVSSDFALVCVFCFVFIFVHFLLFYYFLSFLCPSLATTSSLLATCLSVSFRLISLFFCPTVFPDLFCFAQSFL